MSNTLQCDATGTYSDSSTFDVTSISTWTVSDATLTTVGTNTGLLTYANAGSIWGGDVSVTASDGTISGATRVHVIASDSGSVAPLMPQFNSHWQALGLSPWGTWFGCQEPSGSNLVGSGSAPFTLTANPGSGQGILYQNPVSGWTRSAIQMSGTTTTNVSAASGTGPNLNMTSVAMLAYAQVGPSNSTNIPILGTMNTAKFATDITADSGCPGLNTAAFQKQMVGPYGMNHVGRVHPYLLVLDRTNGVWSAYTDMVTCVTGSIATWISDDTKGFGTMGAAATISGSLLYMAVCTGALAELYSSATSQGAKNAGQFLQTLGWSVPWATCPVDSGSICLPYMPHHWEGLGIVPWTAAWNFSDTYGNPQSYSDWPTKSWAGWQISTSISVDQYQYPPAAGYTNGWTRCGFRFNNTVGHHVSLNPGPWPGGLFDPTGSFAFLTYGAFANIGAGGCIGGIIQGATNSCQAFIGSTGLPTVYSGDMTATGSHVINDGKVHPILLVYDHTNSRAKLYTDLEPVTASFNVLVPVANQTASLVFGGAGNQAPVAAASGVYVYGAFVTGALAESYSTDGVASNFLKTLGWTVGF